MHKIKRYARKEIVYIKAKQNVCVDLFFSFYFFILGRSGDFPGPSANLDAHHSTFAGQPPSGIVRRHDLQHSCREAHHDALHSDILIAC